MIDVLVAILLTVTAPESDALAYKPFDDLPVGWEEMVNPMDPMDASQFIDAVFDDIPRGFVTDTCLMESGCRRAIGIHQGDTRDRRGRSIGKTIYERQLAWGRVDEACPFYQPDPDDETWFDNWTTYGNHGLMFGYNRRFIGTCIPFDWFRIPLVSALATGRKAQRLCKTMRAKGRKCTAEALRIRWAQAKTRKRKREVRKKWRTRLARFKAKRTSVDWKNPPTLEDYRAKQQRPSTEINEQAPAGQSGEDRGAPRWTHTGAISVGRGYRGKGDGVAGDEATTAGGRPNTPRGAIDGQRCPCECVTAAEG